MNDLLVRKQSEFLRSLLEENFQLKKQVRQLKRDVEDLQACNLVNEGQVRRLKIELDQYKHEGQQYDKSQRAAQIF